MTRLLGRMRVAPVLAVAMMLAAGVMGMERAARGDVIAHWTFDELTGPDHDTFVDSGGHPNADGVKLNAIVADKNQVTLDSSGSVPFGKAARFSGRSGAFLDMPHISGIYDHSFTIAAWVNLSMNERSYVLADWAAPNLSFAFGFEPGKNALAPHMSAMLRNEVEKVVRGRKNRPDIVSFRNETPVGLNTWHHVAWTWDRPDDKHGTLSAYLDGVKIASASQVSRVSTTNIMEVRHTMKIGFKQDTDSTFHGAIDELWIFDTALTQDQVTNLMKTNDIATVQVAAAAPVPAPATPAAPAAVTPAAVSPAVTPSGTVATPAATGSPTVAPSQTAVAEAPESVPTPAFLGGHPSPADARAAGDVAITPGAAADGGSGMAATGTTPTASAPVAAVPSAPVSPDFLHAATPRAGTTSLKAIPTVSTVRPHRYTTGRLAGIFSSGLVAIGLSGFLFWAKNERQRMRHARR